MLFIHIYICIHCPNSKFWKTQLACNRLISKKNKENPLPKIWYMCFLWSYYEYFFAPWRFHVLRFLGLTAQTRLIFDFALNWVGGQCFRIVTDCKLKTEFALTCQILGKSFLYRLFTSGFTGHFLSGQRSMTRLLPVTVLKGTESSMNFGSQLPRSEPFLTEKNKSMLVVEPQVWKKQERYKEADSSNLKLENHLAN